MRFLGFEGGTIKDGMMGGAYKWLVANEAELRSAAPEGTEYLGVYAPVFTSDFGELFDEWSGFLDSSPGTLGSKTLYKSLTAATVWGDD